MKTLKDKRKFGWNKIPKNNACKTFGVREGKEYRKWRRTLIKSIKHKLLKCIPLTPSEELFKTHYKLERM